MKQSPATGSQLTLFIVISIAIVFWISACGRLPHRSFSDSQPIETSITAKTPAPINLNNASAAELERLPGVGPALAERIIVYRNEHGNFRRAEHLMMVRGISDRKFRALRSLVRVE